MRLRLSKLLVLGVLGSALVATAASAAIAGSAGMGDSAVGGLRGVGGVNAIAFDAHSDANGANPYGHLSQTIPAGKPGAPQRQDRFNVTCLAVDGNHAAIGLTPSDSATAARFPSGRVLIVIDNGNPSSSGQTVDFYGYQNGTNTCQLYRATQVSNLPDTGDILVNDEL
jgi:hypothetical protein